MLRLGADDRLAARVVRGRRRPVHAGRRRRRPRHAVRSDAGAQRGLRRASWEHLNFGDGRVARRRARRLRRLPGSANRTALDGRGYLGPLRTGRAGRARPAPGLGSAAAAVPAAGARRARARSAASAAGSFVGDTLVAMSAELVLPLTSPLKIGKFGVTALHRSRHRLQQGRAVQRSDAASEGYGGSVWFAAAFLRLNVAVAHGRGASTRVHVGGNVTF